jgi:hypothetical protein
MTKSGGEHISTDGLKAFFQPEHEPHLSVLLSALDAHFLFSEDALSVNAIAPFFKAWYPHVLLSEVLNGLIQGGWLCPLSENCYAIPESLRLSLANNLREHLETTTLKLPDRKLTLGALIEGFLQYFRDEGMGQIEIVDSTSEVVGGRVLRFRERTHWLLLRPSFLKLNVPQEGYLLVFCAIAEGAIEAIADALVDKANLRNRLTLCDLERAQKVNLTHNDLFVYFERYMRHVHGVRLAPVPAFTQALIDRGLLTLEKG